jgi:hypothetical protein
VKTLLSVLVAIAIPASALAQAGDPPTDPPPPPVEPEPEPVVDPPPPPPPPEPEPEPEPEAVESPKASNGAVADDGINRPGGFSLGFGFGWDFPADLQIPDTTSVRIRLPSGLIIEPALEISRLSENDEVGTADNTDNTGVIALAASARFPILSSNNMDLVGVGGGAVAFTAIDPDGGNNDTSITQFALFYGVGVDLWIRRHWAISFTTTNPLLLFEKTSTDGGGGGDTSSTDTFVGLVFDPDVLVMLHLFFD